MLIILTSDNFLSCLILYDHPQPSLISAQWQICVYWHLQIRLLAQLMNNNPWLSPLIISCEADKWECIDNNHIIKIHPQISPFEESINNNLWFSSNFVCNRPMQMYWHVLLRSWGLIKLISKLSVRRVDRKIIMLAYHHHIW